MRASRRMGGGSAAPVAILRDGRPRRRPPQDEVRICLKRFQGALFAGFFAGTTLRDLAAAAMLKHIMTVGGLTLVSRVTGFLRDIMLAAILGAGPVADAFFIALRLPNHFRAIFAEGAFNAAFVPAYAGIRGERGRAPAGLFADRVFTMLLVVEGLLLAVA